jgi:hypothetical protein
MINTPTAPSPGESPATAAGAPDYAAAIDAALPEVKATTLTRQRRSSSWRGAGRGRTPFGPARPGPPRIPNMKEHPTMLMKTKGMKNGI